MLLFVSGLLPVLLLSVLVAGEIALAIATHPRAALRVSGFGALATVFVICVHIAVPIVNHVSPAYAWPGLATDYVLAMGHRLYDGPYAFFWTPQWVYGVSALTPLIYPGAALTAACAFVGRRQNRTPAYFLIAFGLLVFTGLAAFAAYVVFETRNGIPV